MRQTLFALHSSLFTLLLLPCVLTAQDGWKYIGPEEKSIRFLTIHGDVIYTSVTVVPPGGGFSTGRIYRSSDAGASWEVVDSTVIPRRARITFLGGNPPRLIGSNGSTLYYSGDLGMTWDSTYHQNVPPFSRYYVKENVPGLVFAIGAFGTLERLYRSTDYGQTWSDTYDFPKSTDGSQLTVGISPTTPDIYVNVDTDIGGQYLYRSTDDGVTWSYSSLGRIIYQLTVDPDNPNILYASAGGTIVISNDGGGSWQQIYPSGISIIQSSRYPDLLFVFSRPTGRNPGVSFSQDRGMTWTHDSTSAILPFKQISSIDFLSSRI